MKLKLKRKEKQELRREEPEKAEEGSKPVGVSVEWSHGEGDVGCSTKRSAENEK